jgi:hypothetical protein
MFQSFFTVPAAAMFDSFQIVHNPYSQYVVPTMYSVSDQQRIRNWDTAINYSFVGNGARYMQTLSLHTVLSRPMQVNDNIVFLYCPTIPFTPDTPFDTIDKVTHVWYKVIDVQNDMVFFDKQGLLLNTVSSDLLPLHIKCLYEGTYLQFTPPHNMGLSLPTQRTPTVNDPTKSASQRTVMSTIGTHGVNRINDKRRNDIWSVGRQGCAYNQCWRSLRNGVKTSHCLSASHQP